MEPTSKSDYLQFFKNVLAYYEEDFPRKLIEREALTRVPGRKILQTYDMSRWSIAELTMYEFTGEGGYLERGSELVKAVVNGYLRTPRDLWDYFWINTPEGLEACQKAYGSVPEEATWHGYAWWHVGGGAEPLGLSQICQILDRTGGWESAELKRDAETALAQTTDYQVLDRYQQNRRHSYGWLRGKTHNIAMTMTRGILGAARVLPNHPHADQWREWAMETFDRSYNQLSPEDASNYESDWFHSILTMIDILGKGHEAYHLAYHRAYFDHFLEMVTPTGSVVGYGDSGDMGNAAVLPVLEKGAAVLRDGAFKDAAHRHFRAVEALPPEQRSGYVEPLRWFDAYRWADDSVEPNPSRQQINVTQKAKVVLRGGRSAETAYLALSSVEGGGHGHIDANAIAHYSLADCTLLQDGHYHWKHAFYHNRLVWRAGTPPGRMLDFFRPTTKPWHPSPDGTTNVFASEGSNEGLEDAWHPASDEQVSVRFIAGMRGFSASRTVLGPQERTIVLESGGLCLVFDHLQIESTAAAACLNYVPGVVERGDWWRRAVCGIGDQGCDLLVASLQPRRLDAEPEERRNTMEQVVYSSEVGDFSAGLWFVTALCPLEKQTETASAADALHQETIAEAADGSVAQVVLVRTEGNLVTYVCRASCQASVISYQPATLEGGRYDFTVQTDAQLLRLEHAKGRLEAAVVHGTVLEARGKRLVSLPYPGNAQVTVAEGF